MFVYGFGSYLVFMEIGCESFQTLVFPQANVQGCRGGSWPMLWSVFQFRSV
jgi:hypothetical protein